MTNLYYFSPLSILISLSFSLISLSNMLIMSRFIYGMLFLIVLLGNNLSYIVSADVKMTH